MTQITFKELSDGFPWSVHRKMTPNQEGGLGFLAKHGKALEELPTGSGKTAIGIAFLRALKKRGEGPLFYITPNKALVAQVLVQYPLKDLRAAFGRNEHECLYYEEDLRADEIPCTLLIDCAHRVSQDTGETMEGGVKPCPYLLEKFKAMQEGGITVCTMAYYLYAHVMQGREKPAGIVIDEVHEAAAVIRNALTFRITNVHLERSTELVSEFDQSAARQLRAFLRTFKGIVAHKPYSRETMLSQVEVRKLIESLREVEVEPLYDGLAKAVRNRRVSTTVDREALVGLERLVKGVNRYLAALSYALREEGREPLNYVFAVHQMERDQESQHATHALVIRGYYAAPLMKRMLGKATLAYSATIGDPQVFFYESGLKLPFKSFGSDFPTDNTRIFMPTDTPNLAHKERASGQPARVMRQMARACKGFAGKGVRSLVVVVSNAEAERFIKTAGEEGLSVVTYGNGVTAREAAAAFRTGKGDVLLGTSANYGKGLDLPGEVAQAIFVLRPSYPPPDSPEAIFEGERFGARRWALWHWRIVVEALQARGRNVRSTRDLGVTFFISQQFRNFVQPSLPAWLKDAYQGNVTLEQATDETLKLVG